MGGYFAILSNKHISVSASHTTSLYSLSKSSSLLSSWDEGDELVSLFISTSNVCGGWSILCEEGRGGEEEGRSRITVNIFQPTHEKIQKSKCIYVCVNTEMFFWERKWKIKCRDKNRNYASLLRKRMHTASLPPSSAKMVRTTIPFLLPPFYPSFIPICLFILLFMMYFEYLYLAVAFLFGFS